MDNSTIQSGATSSFTDYDVPGPIVSEGPVSNSVDSLAYRVSGNWGSHIKFDHVTMEPSGVNQVEDEFPISKKKNKKDKQSKSSSLRVVNLDDLHN